MTVKKVNTKNNGGESKPVIFAIPVHIENCYCR